MVAHCKTYYMGNSISSFQTLIPCLKNEHLSKLTSIKYFLKTLSLPLLQFYTCMGGSRMNQRKQLLKHLNNIERQIYTQYRVKPLAVKFNLHKQHFTTSLMFVAGLQKFYFNNRDHRI